jgi:hypothetical protein
MSGLQIIECEQRSDEWYAARLGIPTASEFKCLMVTKGKGEGGASKMRDEYRRKLAGERLTGRPTVNYRSPQMDRGAREEDEARTKYEFTRDVETFRVGFIRNGMKGCSPDSLIDANGMLEIKSADPHVYLDFMSRATFPTEHWAQCQGGLWVAEREWNDLAIYCPGLKLLVRRTYRDDQYIAELARQVDLFNEEIEQLLQRYEQYGNPAAVVSMFRQSLAEEATA